MVKNDSFQLFRENQIKSRNFRTSPLRKRKQEKFVHKRKYKLKKEKGYCVLKTKLILKGIKCKNVSIVCCHSTHCYGRIYKQILQQHLMQANNCYTHGLAKPLMLCTLFVELQIAECAKPRRPHSTLLDNTYAEQGGWENTRTYFILFCPGEESCKAEINQVSQS